MKRIVKALQLLSMAGDMSGTLASFTAGLIEFEAETSFLDPVSGSPAHAPSGGGGIRSSDSAAGNSSNFTIPQQTLGPALALQLVSEAIACTLATGTPAATARRPSLYIGARGPWITIPGPFGSASATGSDNRRHTRRVNHTHHCTPPQNGPDVEMTTLKAVPGPEPQALERSPLYQRVITSLETVEELLDANLIGSPQADKVRRLSDVITATRGDILSQHQRAEPGTGEAELTADLLQGFARLAGRLSEAGLLDPPLTTIS